MGADGVSGEALPGARLSVTFPVPPDRAFAYLADPRNRPDWQSSLRAVADVVPAAGGSLTAAGVTWTDVTMVPGLRPAMRVTESDAPLRWVEEGRWGPVRAHLALTFTPCEEGTLVHAHFAVRAVGMGGLVSWASRRAVQSDLRRAARLVADAG